jgi:adenosylcobyric acid synthase
VIPFLRNVGLEEEDGVALEDRRTPERVWQTTADETPERALRIGVVAFPHMANFTDFDAFAAEPSVSLTFLDNPSHVGLCDVLILPGTKQTIDDLTWLRERGFADAIANWHGTLIGICGGFQMLGLSIDDPDGVENGGVHRSVAGLGQLPIRTAMRGEKTVRRATGRPRGNMPAFRGYEIHMGETHYESGAEPFLEILREGEQQVTVDGAVASEGRVWGSYIHGLFDDDPFRHSFIDLARRAKGLAPARSHACVTAERESRIDRWDDHLRKSLDMNLIRDLVSKT